MIKALKIDLEQFNRDFMPEDQVYPCLQDIYDSKADEPEEWQDFLNNLKQALRGKTNNRAFILFLEAVNKTEGLEVVETEVKKYKVSSGYLYLIDKFVKNQNWEKVLNIAQEAIINISDKLRLKASEFLILASEKLEKQDLLLKGKREVFFSDPNNKTFVLLVDEAKKQGLRKEELEGVINFTNKKDNLTILQIEAKLMLGQIDDSIEIIKKSSSLGWSSKKQTGLSFAGILIALSNADPGTKAQSELLKNYIGSAFSYSRYAKECDEYSFICQEIYEGLKNIKFDDIREQELISMIETLGRSRIDGIVSNKHRDSYKKAAQVLCSISEYYIVKNDRQKAFLIINEFRNEKYKRYPAFKKELDSIIKNSKF
jgi:hypothetical protein